MDPQYTWLTSPVADKKAKEAQIKAWLKFNKYYPNADKSKFEAEVVFDEKHNASAEIVSKKVPALRKVFSVAKRNTGVRILNPHSY